MTNKTQWDCLPDLPLIRIISFLEDKDRSSAALVCRSWAKAFNAVELWREKTIVFQESSFYNTAMNAVSFSKMMGSHLKSLTFDYVHQFHSGYWLIQHHLTQVFHQLTGRAQLERLALHSFCYQYRPGRADSNALTRLVATTATFLATQIRLTKLDVSRTIVSDQDGILLLRAAATRSGSSIRTLNIEDFFPRWQVVHRTPEFLPLLRSFSRLRNLVLNYHCLSDGLLSMLAAVHRATLKELSVKCRKGRSMYNSNVTREAWAQLRAAVAPLQVTFKMHSVIRLSVLADMLPPEVPLYRLYYVSVHMVDDINPWLPGEFISYVSHNFSNTLEHVAIDVDHLAPLLDRELLSMVTKCRRLVALTFRGVLRQSVIHSLCNLCLDGKTGLREVSLQFWNSDNYRTVVMQMICEEYKPMLAASGINFQYKFEESV